MSIPFENLEEGQVYLISYYFDKEHQKIRPHTGPSGMRDIPATLVRKFPGDRFTGDRVRLYLGEGDARTELVSFTEYLEFKEAPPLPGIEPGTILGKGAPPLPGIEPGTLPPGSPPKQVREIDPNDDCVICGDPKINAPRYVGICGHSMHNECYKGLVNKASPGEATKKECPFCRQTPYGGRKSRRRKTRKSKKRARKTRRRNK